MEPLPTFQVPSSDDEIVSDPFAEGGCGRYGRTRQLEFGRRGSLDEVDVHEGTEEAHQNRQHGDADDRLHDPAPPPSRHAGTNHDPAA